MSAPFDLEDFRLYGKDLIDWIARYLEEVEDLPIVPSVQPGDIRAQIPTAPPERPEPFSEIIADLDRIVKPGVVGWQSPGWYGFFPANSSPPAVLGELVSAGLAQQGMMWSTSPVTTELESVVMDWLVDLLGLPETFKTTGPGGGVIQMSASDSAHTAFVVARHLKRPQTTIDKMVVYFSEQAHSSLEKGARVAGFDHIRIIPVDSDYAMKADALRSAVVDDVSAGLVPTFVCSALGTTGTTAFDPVRRVAEVAKEFGMWHHVDAAYAGSAMICPEFRYLQDGIELVDSYVFNPHKWMFTNFDCSCFFVADRRPLIQTLSILPPYLRNEASESGQVIDYRDWHVPLGRRFRALKLWFVLRAYGAEWIRETIRKHIRLAQDFAAKLDADPRFELVAPHPLSLVCFRCTQGNEATVALAKRINASGHSYVSPSKLGDMDFIRATIGQTNTEAKHVDQLWETIRGG